MNEPSGDGRRQGEGRAWRAAVCAELYWIEETCAFATRCQTETSRIWRAVNLVLGSAAVLAAGVAGSLMLAAGRTAGALDVVAGGLALLAAMLTALVAMLGPARRETQAVEAAKSFETVQALSRQARQVDLPGHTFEQARKALATLTERWQAVNRSAVPVARWGVRGAERPSPEGADEAMTDRVSEVVSVFVPPRTADQAS